MKGRNSHSRRLSNASDERVSAELMPVNALFIGSFAKHYMAGFRIAHGAIKLKTASNP
jgi:hypothetical protein